MKTVEAKIKALPVRMHMEAAMNAAASAIEALSTSLENAEQAKNGAYSERNKCLVLIALMAQRLGLKVGVGRHVGEDWEADWRNILFIDLPAGQVSWHIHDSEAQMFYFVGVYDAPWDGHDTDEKYRRVVEPGL